MDLNSIRKDDIRAFEDFLAKYSQLLHPNHAAMMEVCDTKSNTSLHTYILAETLNIDCLGEKES